MWIVIGTDRQMRLVRDEGGPSLDELQNEIGGIVDRVLLYRYRDGQRTIDGWLHDEGLLLDLPQSVVLPGMYPDGSGVRGPLVIAASDAEGNTVGLTPKEVESFVLYRPRFPLMVFTNDAGERTDIGEFPVVPRLRMRNPEV
jgi:hypothetical protein